MTVAQRVDALLSAGLIREAGADRASGGRRPTQLALNLQHSFIVAANVETTSSRVALTDLGGIIIADERLDLAVTDGPEPVLHAITESAHRLLEKTQIPLSQV